MIHNHIIIDKRGGKRDRKWHLQLFSYIGVPLVNLLCKIVTWLKFLDVPIYGSGMQLCGPGHLK